MSGASFKKGPIVLHKSGPAPIEYNHLNGGSCATLCNLGEMSVDYAAGLSHYDDLGVCGIEEVSVKSLELTAIATAYGAKNSFD